MSEIRQRLDTGEWVVMAPERLKGKELLKELNPLQDTYPANDDTCPFCPRTDGKFSDNIEIDRINKPGTTKWGARCLENKFQIFSNHEEPPKLPCEFEQNGIYHRYTRYGGHELIIESDIHNKTFGTMNHDEVINVAELYYKRYKALNDGKNLQTIMFKNHGPRSGASQRHPHSQIVSMLVVPTYIRNLIEDARRFFDYRGRCVFCKIIEYEQKIQERIVYENDKFIAFTPYASSVPYEIEIYPKEHFGGFDAMPGEDIPEFSDCLMIVMRKLYIALSNVDFNIIFRNPPYHLSNVLYYHWHLKVIPFLAVPGGFEIGSNMRVNVMNPEECAKKLRNVK